MAERTVAVNFTANTAAYVAGVSRAAGVTGAMGGAASALTKSLIGPGALVFALGAAVKWANETSATQEKFAGEVIKLRTQIGLTTEEMNGMAMAALSLGGSTTKGPQELAEAMFFIASAGLRGKSALDVLRSSAQLSAIGLGETKTVADLLTSAVNAYGEEALSAAYASDVLVNAVRLGKLEADSLAGSVGRVLPIASAMGVSFEEVGGIMAAMSKTGTDAATATTQLRAIMVSLLSPSEQANAVLTELGLTQQGVRDVIMEDGLWPALLLLNDAVGDNTSKFAELFPNVRALAGVMDLLGPQLQGNIELMDGMAESTGVAAEAMAIYSQSAGASIGRLEAEQERLAILQGQYQVGVRAFIRERRINLAQGRADSIAFRQESREMTGILLGELAPAMEVFRNANLGSTEQMRAARGQSETLNAALSTMENTFLRLVQNNEDVAARTDQYTINAMGARAATLEQVEAVIALVEALDRQRAGLPLESEMGAWERGLLNAASASSDAAREENNLARALGYTNAELLDQIQGLRDQFDERLALIDPVYAAIRAEQEYAEATEEVNGLVKDGQTNTEDYINALFEQELAFLRMQGSLAESGVVMDRFVEHLNEMIAENRITEESVQAIIDRLGEQGHAMDLIDGRVVTTTHVHTIVENRVFGEAPGLGVSGRRAAGGPVSAGRAYLVGEQGPELIVPNASGMVLTAGQTQAALGGGATYNVNVHMPPGADGEQVVSALRRWERANGPVPVGVR